MIECYVCHSDRIVGACKGRSGTYLFVCPDHIAPVVEG